MDPNKEFKKIIAQTRILKNPDHRLATFGQTRIKYFFCSEIKEHRDRSRMRKGLVIAEKPQLITPELFKNRFEGFGKETAGFSNWLAQNYGESFQGLEYKFRNENESAHIEYTPLKVLTEEIKKRLTQEESHHSAIIQGPDQSWQISLMKFIVDECMSSFATNLRELGEHGFFDDPEKLFKERKREIQNFFAKAKQDRSLIPALGKKLRLYGLFEEYEDQFFSLVKSNS